HLLCVFILRYCFLVQLCFGPIDVEHFERRSLVTLLFGFDLANHDFISDLGPAPQRRHSRQRAGVSVRAIGVNCCKEKLSEIKEWCESLFRRQFLGGTIQEKWG